MTSAEGIAMDEEKHGIWLKSFVAYGILGALQVGGAPHARMGKKMELRVIDVVRCFAVRIHQSKVVH